MGRATGDGRGWVAPLPCRVSRCVFVFICGYLGLGRNANPWAFLSSLQLVEFEARVSQHRRTFAAVLSLNDAELLRAEGCDLQWHSPKPNIRILAEPDALNPGKKHDGEWHGWLKSLALWSEQHQQMLQLVGPEDKPVATAAAREITIRTTH